MAVQYLGAGQDDGTILGRSTTDKIGFYGLATAIVQPGAITALVTTPTATDIATAVNSIITAIKNLGLTA